VLESSKCDITHEEVYKKFWGGSPAPLSHEGKSARIERGEEASLLLPMQREQERALGERQPIGVISIGSNDIHLLVAASDGTTTFEKKVNQSMLAELIGDVNDGGGSHQSTISSLKRSGNPRPCCA